MIPKPGKELHDKDQSYRPISLLPIISKVFEKLLLRRLKPIVEAKNLIHQFGFRNKHSTIDQVHRITAIIEKALEERKICSSIFLDVSKAFDKVWHEGLKLKLHFPEQLCQFLKSYLADRIFRVKHGNEYSEFKKISAGVPQGSMLDPLLYLLYTNNIPQEGITIATFADDTAILAIGSTVENSTFKLQSAVNRVSSWTKKWRIKLNESKSIHVNFTNKEVENLPIVINNERVPCKNEAKYLGMTLDAKLNWKSHIKKKREELEIKCRKMHWLLGRQSELNIHNKLLLYKQILVPVWAYGLQLWGCTKRTNIKTIHVFQNKVLRNIVNAPWYVRNENIHKDLRMDTVMEVIKTVATKHDQRLHNHVNISVLQMLNSNEVRRLKRTKPSDL